jgi:tetratricopeptide (TPR) repeat protein
MLKLNIFVITFLLLFTVSCSSSNEDLKVGALDHFKRGNQLFQNDQPKAAIAEYKLAISLDPEQERFYYNMGLAYYRLVLYKQAADAYWEAISKKPDFSEAWYNLSLTFNKLGQSEKAFMAYEKYLKLNKVGGKQKLDKPPKPKAGQK